MNIVQSLTAAEYKRQQGSLNLIASENYPSPAVLEALGSVWQNKYAEGYPGKRYYAGNDGADELEATVGRLALQVFDQTGDYGVNVQVLSGSPANAMVFLTALEPGETVMSLDLAGGGHLSHLHATSAYLKFYNLVNYQVASTDRGFEVDVRDFKSKLAQHKPKLVIIGFSAYPAQYKFDELIKLAHAQGALVLADIAHIAGLVATGHHDSPFKHGADFVTMTTHKTLRGPRGAMVFAKHEWMDRLNQTVFPGTSGGPHLHQIAAIGQSLLEVTGDDSYPDNRPFAEYIRAVLDNCKALEQGLSDGGLDIVTPTQTHLALVKLPSSLDSLDVQKKLEEAKIYTNRNQVPFDTKSAWKPSGLRLGTAALTSRGLTSDQAATLGRLVADITLNRTAPHTAAEQVKALLEPLSWYYQQP